jgi:predicted RNase H-like HicB family nuclease
MHYTVTCDWDEEARVWYVAETDVPGLATEADTPEAMERKLRHMIGELLALNEPLDPHDNDTFALITRKRELALSA